MRPDPLPGRWALGNIIVMCPPQKSGKQTQNKFHAAASLKVKCLLDLKVY